MVAAAFIYSFTFIIRFSFFFPVFYCFFKTHFYHRFFKKNNGSHVCITNESKFAKQFTTLGLREFTLPTMDLTLQFEGACRTLTISFFVGNRYSTYNGPPTDTSSERAFTAFGV